MARFTEIADSSVFLKFIMSATGILLIIFLGGHLVGNLQLFVGKTAYNTYAHFLQSLGKFLWAFRFVMAFALILHIWTSIVLKFKNLSAKPSAYAIKKFVKAEFSARTMIWTGIMIAIFVFYHLAQFTFRVTHPELSSLKDALGGVDIYTIVVKSFQIPVISISYIVALALLGFHLHHAIESFFQTLGLKNERFEFIIIKITKISAYIITAGYIFIPLAVMLGIIN